MQPIPQGSKIRVYVNDGDDMLVLPDPTAGLLQQRIAIISAMVLLIVYNYVVILLNHPPGIWIFMVPFSILVLSFGSYALYRVFRPPLPETLTFSNTCLRYDSGLPAFTLGRFYSFTEYWSFMFPRRRQMAITPGQLLALELRKHPKRDRLTIDMNLKRIEIGRGLADIEREWLYGVIREKYQLPVEKGNV